MHKHRAEMPEKDDLSIPGFEVVHQFVRHASSDLELCYNLGKLLDQRRDCLLALMKAVREMSLEKEILKH